MEDCRNFVSEGVKIYIQIAKVLQNKVCKFLQNLIILDGSNKRVKSGNSLRNKRAQDRTRTGDLVLTKDVLCLLSYLGKNIWSGRRDSNPRHPAWKAGTLPTELLPPISHSIIWWWGEDSNPRRLCQQIYSLPPLSTWVPHHLTQLFNSWRRDLNPRPGDYKSPALPLSYASFFIKERIQGSII